MHQVPPRLPGAHAGGVRRRRSPGRPPVRRRGPRRRGGSAGRAVRRAVGQAARPAHARGDRARPRDGATSPTCVKCRPPGNRDPLPDEIDACRPWLEAAARPDRPQGRDHARQLRRRNSLLATKEGITRLRGRTLPVRPPAWSCPRSTRPPCCGAGASRWPRCGPTSSGPSRRWSTPARRPRPRAGGLDAMNRVDGPHRLGRGDARARRRLWPSCAGRATSSCSPATSARARPRSPRASAPRSASTEPITSPTFMLARAVRGASASRCTTSTSTGSTSSRRCSTSGCPRCSTTRRVVVIEWGDAVAASLPADYLEVRLTLRRRRRRPPARLPLGRRPVAQPACCRSGGPSPPWDDEGEWGRRADPRHRDAPPSRSAAPSAATRGSSPRPIPPGAGATPRR